MALARVSRTTPATPGSPMTSAGMTMLRLKSPSHPLTGSSPNCTAKSRMRKGAEMKTGVERKKSVRLTSAVSSHRPCWYAAINPSGMPMLTASSIAARPSCTDTHILGRMSSATVRPR